MARIIALIALLATLCSGFSTASVPQLRSARAPATLQRTTTPVAVVVDITSSEEFNAALESAGDKLVVVDYSTSWCGPCKIIAPKYDEFSEKYGAVSFLKVRRRTAEQCQRMQHSVWCARAQRSVARVCGGAPQVMGDSSPAADKLMRSQGVRALPSFHFVSALPSRAVAFIASACLTRTMVPPPPCPRLLSPPPRSGRAASRSTASAAPRRRPCRTRSRPTCRCLFRRRPFFARSSPKQKGAAGRRSVERTRRAPPASDTYAAHAGPAHRDTQSSEPTCSTV